MEAVVCATCGRIVLAEHVNAKGNCIVCEPSQKALVAEEPQR